MELPIFQDHPKVLSKAEVTDSRYSLERVAQTHRIPRPREEGQITSEGRNVLLFILIWLFKDLGELSDPFTFCTFLRMLFQSGRKVIMQKKAEDRRRELRKKARRSSVQCKDGRARIKRTSNGGKPSRRKLEGPWAGRPGHARHASGHRGPRSRAPLAQRRESGQLESSRPGLARCRTRRPQEGAPGSVPAARCPRLAPLPRHLRAARRRGCGTARGQVSRARLASSFRPSQLAFEGVKRGAPISAPLDFCPTSSSIAPSRGNVSDLSPPQSSYRPFQAHVGKRGGRTGDGVCAGRGSRSRWR